MRWLTGFFRRARRNKTSDAVSAADDENTVVVSNDNISSDTDQRTPVSASSERLSWPARDKSKQEGPSSRGIVGAVRHDAPTQRVDAAEAAKLLRVDRTSHGSSGQVETQLIGKGGVVHDDPVVGWVVIIEGPGKGRSLELGMGANHVGRAPT